jgi:hypothetical protein
MYAIIRMSCVLGFAAIASCTSSSQRSQPDADPSQTPPLGHDQIEAWLAAGSYKSWACENAVHESRQPSPHGYNRICSNRVISTHVSGSGAWPEGAAAVKELYTSSDGTTPVGYAVYLKMDADSAGGAHWYWYERVPLDSMAPHDDRGVVADGVGSSGPAMSICVGCHMGAGKDEMHTPSRGGRDEVYTPVD